MFRTHQKVWAAAFAAFLCLATTASAALGAPGTAREPNVAQYHSQSAGQYHNGATRFRGGSAPNGASGASAGELRAAIYAAVISPILHFQSTITTASTSLAKDYSIDRRIPPSIEPRSGDLRRMLQIGAVLGMIYIAFLATWIWATRLRARPPGSARA